MTIKAHPLTWPAGWPRTARENRKPAPFRTKQRSGSSARSFARELTINDAIERVLEQLRHMGIKRDDLVISTNIETRLDGLPRSDRSNPGDSGASVWWQAADGTRKVMAIDIYTRTADNLAAIAASLDAMRAMERHGGTVVQNRAFDGFTALPSPETVNTTGWRQIIGVDPACRDIDVVRRAYRSRATALHPDRPDGSAEAMANLNAAWQAAQAELEGR